MTRRCSHCSHNGHNSRTCPNRGVKLFGVRLTDGLIRKCASMGNLTHYANSGAQNGVASALDSIGDTPDHLSAAADGYASEDFVTGSPSSRERKKGTPWTEEEHRMFLLGLQKLGKGDWRGIARNYVVSRTPTQVASHAQKYFIRQMNVSRRKRRSSLFDLVPDESFDAPVLPREFLNASVPQAEPEHCDQLPGAMDEEGESVVSANSNESDPSPPVSENTQFPYPVMYPAFVAPYFPLAIPVWSGYNTAPPKQEGHEIFKPRAVHSTSLINVDGLVGMSRLSLGDTIAAQTPLSLKLVEGSMRQSAFHPNPSSGTSGMNSSSNPIHAL